MRKLRDVFARPSLDEALNQYLDKYDKRPGPSSPALKSTLSIIPADQGPPEIRRARSKGEDDLATILQSLSHFNPELARQIKADVDQGKHLCTEQTELVLSETTKRMEAERRAAMDRSTVSPPSILKSGSMGSYHRDGRLKSVTFEADDTASMIERKQQKMSDIVDALRMMRSEASFDSALKDEAGFELKPLLDEMTATKDTKRGDFLRKRLRQTMKQVRALRGANKEQAREEATKDTRKAMESSEEREPATEREPTTEAAPKCTNCPHCMAALAKAAKSFDSNGDNSIISATPMVPFEPDKEGKEEPALAPATAPITIPRSRSKPNRVRSFLKRAVWRQASELRKDFADLDYVAQEIQQDLNGTFHCTTYEEHVGSFSSQFSSDESSYESDGDDSSIATIDALLLSLSSAFSADSEAASAAPGSARWWFD